MRRLLTSAVLAACSFNAYASKSCQCSKLSMRLNIFVRIVSAFLMSTAASASDDGVHWGYSGDSGPDHWAELSPDYAACGIGVNQSPVDITSTIEAELEPLVFDYHTGSIDIVNNGHTLQVNAEPGSVLKIGSETFQLEQLHFHSPSEHQIDGELFPLEAHLVHRDDRGFLAVVAVLFRTGASNADLAKLGKSAPLVGEAAPIDIDFGSLKLHRNHESYYRYSGSLTTPPCTEGVRWYVLKAAGTVAPERVENFVSWIGEDARSPQPINARVVLEH
jgi:carbonic anhydrase